MAPPINILWTYPVYVASYPILLRLLYNNKKWYFFFCFMFQTVGVPIVLQ